MWPALFFQCSNWNSLSDDSRRLTGQSDVDSATHQRTACFLVPFSKPESQGAVASLLLAPPVVQLALANPHFATHVCKHQQLSHIVLEGILPLEMFSKPSHPRSYGLGLLKEDAGERVLLGT